MSEAGLSRTRQARAWSGPMGLAAIAVVLAQVIWRAAYLNGSYWNQDDYFFLNRARESGLTWDFLFADAAGHVNPGQQLVVWLQDNIDSMGWGLAAGTVLVFETLATAAMWHLLTKLLPDRWARVPLLAAFALTPLTLASTLWWAAMLALWPTVLLTIVSGIFLLRALRRERFGVWNYVFCVVAYLLAFAFHERAVLVPVTLGALAIFETTDRGLFRPVLAALRRSWGLWVALVLVTAGLIVAHQLATEVQNSRPDKVSDYLRLVWEYVGRTSLPGLLSGPWVQDVNGGAVVPQFLGVVLGLIGFAALLVLARSFGGRRTSWAIAYFVVFLLADLGLLLYGRSGFGPIIALDPRYAADLPVAFVIACAVALRDDGWTRLTAAASRPKVAAIAVTGVYLVGAAITTTQIGPKLQSSDDKEFFENLTAALHEEPQTVLVDELAPPGILLPLYGDDSLLSKVLSRLPENPRFDLPSELLRSVAEDGKLEPVQLADPARMEPGPVPSCGYSVESRRRIPLLREVEGRVVVQLDYFTNLDTEGSVSVAGSTTQLRFTPGPHRVEWVLEVPADEPADEVVVQIPPTGSAVCISGLAVGAVLRPY